MQTEPMSKLCPWVIRDWAFNLCFDGKEFDSFDDAWGFLYEQFPNGDEDSTFDDYFVYQEGYI